MSNTFMTAPTLLFTSESVTEGHPDKICDQISDAVLDWSLSQSPTARVACEAGVKSDDEADWVSVFGEVTPLPPVEVVRQLVRTTLREIGYTKREYGTSDSSAHIDVHLSGQSADIALGVNRALEVKQGEHEAELETGAGDQGMMVGFACDETKELMPLPIALAHRLCRRLTQVRKEGTLAYLRPDGKSQVTVEYSYGRPVRVDTVVISTQHAPDVEQAQIEADLRTHVIEPVVPGGLMKQTRVLVNPTGRFVIGGPYGDSGLTGRKIIVDTYGGMARHGGGAFSGKDPTKVDRSAAYAARYVAKNVVAAGLASRFEIHLAYAIGVAKPVSIMIEAFGTNTIPEAKILELIEAHFDLRPAAIIRDLHLQRPIFKATAAYGHFGRDDIDAPWERTDKAAALRAAAGIAEPVIAR
ncbi:MAG TPA: methionine adenosyltransferase [Chloroflexota bacterium]|nr:methionine adenosyltransferase [Chloroflexota bacterium]